MQKNQIKFYKRILRNIDNKKREVYLLNDYYKSLLEFPAQCFGYQPFQNCQFVSLDTQMILTQLGEQIIQITIINQQQQVLINEIVKPQGKVLDYRTSITGFSQKSFVGIDKYYHNIKNLVCEIIKNKIVVGHDLANDFKALKISHKNFIDTVILYQYKPLPIKSKLKNISFQYLNFPIQYLHHNALEDAQAALRLTKFHIQNGRGTVQFIETDPILFKQPSQIIKEIELDKSKIIGFFLRGSRATGNEDQNSDYDYILVYDTEALINGALITLFKIDIAFYDYKSFDKLLNDNDISLLEIFFLQKQFQIINQIKPPKIDLIKLREKCTFHVYKSINRSKIYYREKNILKALKCLYLSYRFYDNYDQLATFGAIVEYRRTLYVWKQMYDNYQNKKFFPVELIYEHYSKFVKDFGTNFRLKYPTIKKTPQYKNKVMTSQISHNKNSQSSYQEVSKQEIEYSSNVNVETIKPKKKYIEKQIAFQRYQKQNQLNIRQYLKERSLDSLNDDFKIKSQRHILYPNLIQLVYMNSANFHKKIPNQCRGIILDQKRNYEVVAFPYYKFFDYNDKKFSQLKQFNWENAQLYQKLDGSICSLYFYDNQWHVASSSKPDGNGQYCFQNSQKKTTFNKQFWRIFYKNKYKLPNKQDANLTFIFQMLSVNHMIVVNIKVDRLVLHGVRNRINLKQLPLEQFEQKYNFEIIKPLNIKFKNIQDIVQLAQKLDPREQQGFILKDQKNLRIKVKSSNYLRASWVAPLNGNIIDKKFLLDIIIKQQHQNFMAYCPEWQSTIVQLLEKIQKIKDYLFNTYQKYKSLSQKQFALQVQKNEKAQLQFIFFLIKKQSLTRQNFCQILNINKLNMLLSLEI